VFNILNPKGNANQNTSEVPPDPVKMLIIKKTTNASKVVGRKGNLI
jgi:hypothetical protein